MVIQMDSDENKSKDPMVPRDLLEEVILAIIDHPEEMKIIEIENPESGSTVLEVRVGAADRGKVIGKGGVIAFSLRNLFGLIGQQSGMNIEVRIDAGPDHKPRPRQRNNNYNRGPAIPQGMILVPVQGGYGFQQGNRFQGRPNNNRRTRNG